jgi:hypothetical protein
MSQSRQPFVEKSPTFGYCHILRDHLLIKMILSVVNFTQINIYSMNVAEIGIHTE